MAAIPNEIKQIEQWTYSASPEELKRPAYTEYKHNGAMDYETAKEVAGDDRYVGFYVTDEDPYVLIDIDHIDNPEEPENELPPQFLKLFTKYRTYCEVSPSGKGIRAIYKLPDAKDKSLVNGHTFYSNELDDKRSIQMSIAPPWNTITGNDLPYSKSSITTVSLDEFQTCFTIKFKVQDMDTKEHKTSFADGPLPDIGAVRAALFGLPLDQNRRIRRAFKKVTGNQYTHYAYWVKILMSLHHYGDSCDKSPMCLDLAIAWSRKDPTSFKGDDEVIAKWRSFDANRDEGVTYKTLLKIFYEYSIHWPYCKANTRLPIHSQYTNFETLLDYYNITFKKDVFNRHIVYMKGDRDILERWFAHRANSIWYFDEYVGPFDSKSLSVVFLPFAQENGFIGVTPTVTAMYATQVFNTTAKTIDFFRRYLETPFEELPEEMQDNGENYKISSFEKLWGCIHLSEHTSKDKRNLYKLLFRKWWMGFLRSMYYTGEYRTNSGILLLTGVENTYKTSFFRYLFPAFFRNKIAFTTHGFGNPSDLRDVTKIAAASQVVVFDEIEQHFTGDQAEKGFKKLMDNEPQTFIDKYEVTPTTYYPVAVYGATSNESEFKLSSMGMRRLFTIPIKQIDTDTELKLCWHAVLNDLKKQYDEEMAAGKVPWGVSNITVTELTNANQSLRSKTNLDIIMESMWDFNETFDRLIGVSNFQHDATLRLMTFDNILTLIEAYSNFGNVTPVALYRTLERKCAVYTGTDREELRIAKPKCRIEKGSAHQSRHKRWVMPSLKPEAESKISYVLSSLNV